MSNCETVDNKSYFYNQYSKCFYCKQPFKQGHFSQWFCHNLDCMKRRHVIQQTEYRQRRRKKGLGTQEVMAELYA